MSVAKKAPILRLSFVIVVLLLLGAVYSLSSLARATTWVRHTDDVRVAVGHLRSTLLDAETGARGYAVAGERAFLA
ncbi:MAG TPA: CHASE3 domain-containing protein, partial [Polyangia bacterium]|nr:CHASE3 domain-containing protein [Polyangia bacterium]